MAWFKNVPTSVFSGPAPWQEPQSTLAADPTPKVLLDPTPEELGDIALACAKLWELDHNRLTPGVDLKLNIGNGQ